MEFTVRNPDDEAVIMRLADQFGITPGQVIERAVVIYEFWASLRADQRLGVVHDDGTVERVTISWSPHTVFDTEGAELTDQMATARVWIRREAPRRKWRWRK